MLYCMILSIPGFPLLNEGSVSVSEFSGNGIDSEPLEEEMSESSDLVKEWTRESLRKADGSGFGNDDGYAGMCGYLRSFGRLSDVFPEERPENAVLTAFSVGSGEKRLLCPSMV